MSEYYKITRSVDWNYGGPKWRLSRSKIDLFMDCPRCFYIDNKLGLARPKGPSFTLNVAVDALLKKEFDVHRAAKTVHPLLKKYAIEAIPFSHEELEKWRYNFEGIQHYHEPTGFTISGAIDDVWHDGKGNLIIVDYKATSKDGKIESLEDTKWQNQYKRQMEIFQWLFRKNGFSVSKTGYFVYVNGLKDKKAFDGKLEFDVTLIPHKGNDAWVEGILLNIKKCLDDERIPIYTKECDYCRYIETMGTVLRADAFRVKANAEKLVKKTNKKTSQKTTLF